MATSHDADSQSHTHPPADAAALEAQASLPRPAALWKQMTEQQRQDASRAFWLDSDSTVEQLETYALMARRLNFRMKSVQSLPLERKAKHLMAMGNVSDGVAGRLLVTYHLACQRPMMAAFLDALEIPHENGLIAEEDTTRPEPAKLKEAVATLRGAYPAEDVDLYFATLMLQDFDTWGGLSELVTPGPAAD